MAKKLSRQDIKKYKQKLEKEREGTLESIEELKESDPFNDPDHASDNAAVDTDVREQIGHDSIEAQVKDLQRRAQKIDLALEKITKGRYGFCERCGSAIPAGRLDLVPEARYCMNCERELSK